MKKLPIGIQTFSKLIEENYLYIDKTKYLYEFVTEGGYYFISRPRRFGKSLMLSTLKELFRGNQELFKGLWIYDQITWEQHPVIMIDFNIVTHDKNIEVFDRTLLNLLLNQAKEYQISITETDPKNVLQILVTELAKQNKVVLLIDEYDKPIIDYLHKSEKAKENKEYLASFYEAIKGLDQHFKFVMLTGVTKFSKVSIFSKLNNLRDLTISEEYAGMMGIEQTELEEYFAEGIKKAQAKYQDSEILTTIKKWYNGYSWDGKISVSNPFSILNFFTELNFRNYWFETGTPTFLIENMRQHEYELANLEKSEVDEYLLSSYDIDQIEVTPLMFQSGYLTIKEKRFGYENAPVYSLSVPNYEVRQSLLSFVLARYSGKETAKVKPPYLQMLDKLAQGKIEEFMTLLRSAYAMIPYNLYVDREAYYHSIFYLMLALLGAEIDVEVLTDKGRIDGVIQFAERIYVIEFKLGTAVEALQQIKARRYWERYAGKKKEIYLLGVGGFQEKEIEYLVEKLEM